MKLHQLLLFCVAGYSGNDFFPPMQTHPPTVAEGLFVNGLFPNFSNDPATHFLSPGTASGLDLTNFPSPALPQAHAHNDYEHDRPLLDALAQGFTYIEADVHLIDNELFVAHVTPLFPSEKRTLKQLYLDPLDEIVQQRGGRVFPYINLPLHLMIDIKTDAAATYAALKTYLEPYHHLLTSIENGVKTERAVTVFLSGNRPVAQVLSEQKTYLALDGRIEDLGKGIPHELMPVVSERFANVLGWELLAFQRTEKQWLILQKLANLTHSEGKKLRLWASPEDEAIWEKLLAAGCDLINSDELVRLRQFLQRREMACPAVRNL